MKTIKEKQTEVVLGLYQTITKNKMILKFGKVTKLNGNTLTLNLSLLDTNSPTEIINIVNKLITNK